VCRLKYQIDSLSALTVLRNAICRVRGATINAIIILPGKAVPAPVWHRMFSFSFSDKLACIGCNLEAVPGDVCHLWQFFYPKNL
jgi:hypothetical protein